MKTWALSLLLVISAVGSAGAVDDGPVAVPAPPPGAPSATPAPEARYNAGHALAKQRDWRGAEAAYRDALRAPRVEGHARVGAHEPLVRER